MTPVVKSKKLDNVCYDIRGPILSHAKEMEEEGHHIIKLNIGNPAQFGFEAPDEMKSIHYQWKEGMPLFSEMIKKRNHDWWKGKKSVWQKTLSPKITGRDYVEGLGLKVPALYWTGKNLEDVPSFDEETYHQCMYLDLLLFFCRAQRDKQFDACLPRFLVFAQDSCGSVAEGSYFLRNEARRALFFVEALHPVSDAVESVFPAIN